MLYSIDERQLLDLWTAVHCLGHIREIRDPLAQSEIITQAQIHLTAFVLDLQPFADDRARFASPTIFNA
jgi:hypothetical protein